SDFGFDIRDPIFNLNYLFSNGSPPAAPGLECGLNPTPSGLPDCVYDTAVCGPQVRIPDSAYAFEFAPSGDVAGPPNTTIQFTRTIQLTQAALDSQALSVAVEALDCDVVSAAEGSALQQMNNGNGPYYFEPEVFPGQGARLGTLFDFLGSVVLLAGGVPHDIVELTIEAETPATGCVQAELNFVDGVIGDPVGENIVVVNAGESITPVTTGTTWNVCAFGPPIRAPAPDDILKNRYISIDPRGASGTNPSSHHIRVSINNTQVNGLVGLGPWWATAPVNGQPPSPATCISIVSATKPATEPDWSGCSTLHLTGCPIVPTTTYAIAVEAGGTLSAAALFDTQAKPGVKWIGDVVGKFTGPAGNPPNVWTAPNGTVNIDDAFSAIKTFIDPNATNATHLSVTDMHPVLNGVQMTLLVNINDALIVIQGFGGKTYGEVASPFPDDEIPDLTECP
ncbi:MAG: hypothetical protein IH987_15590, partial [Planctomycetes bacterium]|nr:hypothetical protein [Planctomycetota bacterium]